MTSFTLLLTCTTDVHHAQSLALYVIIYESFFFCVNFFICANDFEFLHIVKISFYLSLFVKIYIYAHLWESLLLSIFYRHQFWNVFFQGATLKCTHVLKYIFSGSNYFNLLICGCWLVWLLLYVFDKSFHHKQMLF